MNLTISKTDSSEPNSFSLSETQQNPFLNKIQTSSNLIFKKDLIKNGKFAKIFCNRIQTRTFALKISHEKEISCSILKKEIKILKHIYKNVKKIPTGIQAPVYSLPSKTPNKAGYITKYYDCDLFTFFKKIESGEFKISQQECFLYALQLIKGLYFLHKEKNTIHRNIKPENCLIEKLNEGKNVQFNMCLSDFGEALQLENKEKNKHFSLKNSFFSKEYSHEDDNKALFWLFFLFEQESHRTELLNEIHILLKAMDVYSLALTLEKTLLKSLKNDSEINGLLKKMLDDDYTKRPSIRESLQKFKQLNLKIFNSTSKKFTGSLNQGRAFVDASFS